MSGTNFNMFNNTFYYGAITDTGQFFPKRIIQSNQLQPDHAPLTFFDDLEDDLTGLSSTKSNLIALCKNSIYRMSGGFNTVGQGALTHDKISDIMGCLNAKGIVKTEVGVFFAGNDGFYYTDGYQLIKISLEINKIYQTLTASDNQKQSIQGAYDKDTRRVWWAMKSTPTSVDNDIAYVFYIPIFVYIGIMIMLRQKIGDSLATVQTALPKIALSLSTRRSSPRVCVGS